MLLGRAIGRWVGGTALVGLASCGGGGYGGGGGGGGGGGPPTAVFVSSLSGAHETSVVDASARATAFVRVTDDGHVEFAVTGEAEWTGAVTALDIHLGSAGGNGPAVVDLLAGGAFDPATRTAAGSVTTSTSIAKAILGNPAIYYVDAHTSTAASGLARDQMHPLGSLDVHALVLGSLETTVVDATARGAAALQVHADGSVGWVVATSTPAVSLVTQAHVHAGAAGVAGPILVDLDVPTATADAALGTLTGTVTPPLSALSRIAFDPSAFYVDVHTAAAPDGVARGALDTTPVLLWSAPRGSLEPVVVDAAARGGLALSLDSLTTGRAHLAVPAVQGIASVTGASVRFGAPGTTGPVVLDLTSGADFAKSASVSAAAGSVDLDPTLFARLLGNPAAFYAEFTTSAAPAGLQRGPLTRNAPRVRAVMTGSQVVPPSDPSALGSADVTFTDIQACAFVLDMTNPTASAVTSFHLHEGAAGATGAVLVDLLTGSSVRVGNTISGDAIFSGDTAARVLADPASFYADVHTAIHPNGMARGPLALLTEDVPPAGLSFTTPVTYTTGAPIAPNVPHSAGGAVASYGVAPALPAGLSIDATTGVISGTPTLATAAADYVVTATNASGSTQATVHVTVNVAAPASLSYATPVTYVVGVAIAPNSPSSTGGAIASYSVSPALPAALALDPTTGVISGTPTSPAAGADYTVTATNASGSAFATVHVQVDATLAAPSGLSYTTPVTYTTGTTITPNAPTIGGGAVSSWSISPALAAGLAFNTATGVISGTPTATATGADHTVTASNASGSTQATVHVTVDLGAPANLAYDYNPSFGYVSYGTFTTMTPSSTGGAVATYSISPALPTGISINASTGVISGTPTATSSATTYTVTATNAAGSTTVSVTITIYT